MGAGQSVAAPRVCVLRVRRLLFYTQPRINRDWIRVAPPTAILCMALPAPLCVVTRETTLFSRFRILSSRQQLTDSISLPVSPRFSSRLARLSYLARFVHDTGCAQRHTQKETFFECGAGFWNDQVCGCMARVSHNGRGLQLARALFEECRIGRCVRGAPRHRHEAVAVAHLISARASSMRVCADSAAMSSGAGTAHTVLLLLVPFAAAGRAARRESLRTRSSRGQYWCLAHYS